MSDFNVDWASLLADAVEKPGLISTAYSRFWNYSTGNQLLALWQCMLRGLEPGPINTFLGWLELKRHVKKGEKALTLCMPVTVKRKAKAENAEMRDDAHPDEDVFTRFIYRPHWFVLAQTEGEAYVPTVLPEWNEAAALTSLKIERVPFSHLNGNAQGYAVERNVAVSPIAALPHKTLLHELAHVILGHTEELKRMDDDDFTPVNIREVEAECVALICCECLGLPGSEFCRGYIQNWLGKEQIPDRSVQKIFRAADTLLKAGRPDADSNNP
jgi:antirestriction protein ArdC